MVLSSMCATVVHVFVKQAGELYAFPKLLTSDISPADWHQSFFLRSLLALRQISHHQIFNIPLHQLHPRPARGHRKISMGVDPELRKRDVLRAQN
jgi:hypothetical protein